MPERSVKKFSVRAAEAPTRSRPSNYPEPYASMMSGRVKRPLGDLFQLESFGVNHVTLPAGSISALHHRHSVQDEFVIVLAGEITLVHGEGETLLVAGDCAGFRHGGTAHHLINRSDADASYLEVGDRQTGDTVAYPSDDLQAIRAGLGWKFVHKDGRPY